MSNMVITRRATLAGMGVAAAAALAGCNTPQSTAGPAGAAPQAVSGYRIANITVDASAVAAQSGDLTGQWVQQSLPGALARAFAAHMAPGDPSGATLSVTVNSVYLGQGGPGDPDVMIGVATLSGGGAPTRTTTLKGTSTYTPSPSDTALVEQTNHYRVVALSQAYAGWLVRKWRR